MMRPEPDSSIPILVAFRSWRLTAVISAAAGLAAGSFAFARGRRYEATVSLITVSSPRAAGLASSSLAASLLGGVVGMGLEPTPPFVVQLANMDGLLNAVARSPVDTDGGTTVIDRIQGQSSTTMRYDRLLAAMRKVVSARFDRETGVVTLSVVHRDSALARLVANRLVDEVSRTFIRVSKAQASGLHRGQDERVDSAGRQLGRAERAMVVFQSSNRQIMPYSLASVQRDALQRQIDIAQAMYQQAVTEREAAIAKELEETPAVVILDPVPEQLPPVPRRVLFWSIVVVLLTAFVASGTMIVREGVRLRGRG